MKCTNLLRSALVGVFACALFLWLSSVNDGPIEKAMVPPAANDSAQYDTHLPGRVDPSESVRVTARDEAAVEFLVTQGGALVTGADVIAVNSDSMSLSGDNRKALGVSVNGVLAATLQDLSSWRYVVARKGASYAYADAPRRAGACGIDLPVGAQLVVRASDMKGHPIPGCRVILSEDILPMAPSFLDGSMDWSPLPGRSLRRIFGGVTDDKGLLDMSGLPPGSYRLDARCDCFIPYSGAFGALVRVGDRGTHDIVLAPLLAEVVLFDGDEVLDYRVMAPSAGVVAGMTLPIVYQAKVALEARFPGSIVIVGSTKTGTYRANAAIQAYARTSGWASHAVSLRSIATIESPTRISLQRGGKNVDSEILVSIVDPGGIELNEAALYLCDHSSAPGVGNSFQITSGKSRLAPKGDWVIRSADALLRSEIEMAVKIDDGQNRITVRLGRPWRKVQLDVRYRGLPMLGGELEIETAAGSRTVSLGVANVPIWVPCGPVAVNWIARDGSSKSVDAVVSSGDGIASIEVAYEP